MRNGITRLGLIYPEGGGEYEYYQFAEQTDYRVRPLVVCARAYGADKAHDPEELARTGRVDLLERTAHSLVPLAPDSAMWACTSGSFILGRAHAEKQVAAIEAIAGCPSGSTSIAFVDALRALGIGRVAVLGPYPEPATRAFVSFLAEYGVEVADVRWLDAAGGQLAFMLPKDDFRAAARALDIPADGALLIPDTAVGAVALIDELEAALDRPVLTANQVTLWRGLRLAGDGTTAPGWGRLLRET